MKSLKSLLWISWRGLVRPGTRLVTFVCVFAVTLMVFLPLEVFGVLLGLHNVQRRIILEDPLTLCLWIGQPGLEEQRFTPERKESLAEIVQAEPGVEGWFAFHEVQLFFASFSNPSAGTMPVTGRTWDSSEHLLLARMRQAPQENRSGLFLSRELLEQLGCEDIAEANHIVVEAPNHELVEVPIIGVFDRLPWGYQFVAEFSWYSEFIKRYADVRVTDLITGPLPADWPPPSELPSAARSALDTYRLLLPQIDENRWKMETWISTGYRIREWTAFLQKISMIMSQEGFSPSDDKFWKQAQPFNSQIVSQSVPTENMAVVYMRDTRSLRPLKEKLEQSGFYVRDTDDTITRLESLSRSTLIRLGFVTAFFLLIFCGFMLALGAIQAMRVEAQLHQIALLKAIGMSEDRLAWLFLVQSFVIWLVASAIATAVSFPLGRFVVAPALIPESTRYANVAFHFDFMMAFSITFGVAIFWSAMTLYTTRRAIRYSPARSLQAL